MADTEQRYDAFISYRHIQPDRSVAERIHRKLEAFRLPKEIASKIGKNRLDRVFRDEAEFAVSDDLSESITDALRRSEYLIIVASPKYLESPWCMREVETFLKLKDRKHILIALADGDPDTSFPKLLLYEDVLKTDEDGNVTRETIVHEPLAADCRAEKASERNKKVDLSVLRLIASIFELSFDDLKQRQREAEIKRRRRIGFIILGVLLVILLQSFFFIWRITKQNRLMKEQNEKVLAATSGTLLSEGKRMDAIYTARSILPDTDEKDFNDEAAVALINALEVYSESDEYVQKHEFKMDFSVSSIVYSKTGKYFSVYDGDVTNHIYETETGKEVLSLPFYSFSTLAFCGDEGVVYQQKKGEYRYQSILEKVEKPVYFYEEGLLYSIPNGNSVAIVSDTKICVYSDGAIRYTVDCSEILSAYGLEKPDMSVSFSPDGKYAVLFYNFPLQNCTAIVKVSLSTGKAEQIASLSSTIVGASIKNNKMSVISYAYDEDESVYNELIIMSVTSGDIIAYKEVQDYYVNVMMNDEIVITVSNNQIYYYDYDLNLQTTKPLKEDYTFSKMTDDGIFFITDVGGNYYMIDKDEFRTDSIGRNRFKLYTSVEYVSDQIFVHMFGSSYITVYAKKESSYLHAYNNSYTNIDFYENRELGVVDKKAFLAKASKYDSDLEKLSVRKAIQCDGGNAIMIQATDDQIRIYDSKTYKLLKTSYAIEGIVYNFVYDAKNKVYAISTDSIHLFDKRLKHIVSLPGLSLVGYDTKTKDMILYDESNKLYTIEIISYKEMIRMADELLNGYEPDERTKEKYGL